MSGALIRSMELRIKDLERYIEHLEQSIRILKLERTAYQIKDAGERRPLPRPDLG